jgi:hypothetical protein
LTPRQWAKIEAEFRVWSFHIYYRRSFKDEHDLVVRFIKALKASCQPIRDRQAVLDWYEKGVRHNDDDEKPGGSE